MRAIVNGKLVDIGNNATSNELKRMAGVERSDSLVKIAGNRAELVNDNDQIESGGRYRSIPPLVQG